MTNPVKCYELSRGGASRIRTDDQGFANPCLTAWLWRQGSLVRLPKRSCRQSVPRARPDSRGARPISSEVTGVSHNHPICIDVQIGDKAAANRFVANHSIADPGVALIHR